VRRSALALVLVLAVAAPLATRATARDGALEARAATAAAPIALRGRRPAHGPWRSYLWLKLVRTDIVNFTVCAVWRQRPPQASCRAAPGNRLPAGTIMRLEQRPIGKGLRRSDSRGWGMVGASTDAALEAVLSNAVSGNRVGTVTYRVTLRRIAGGRALATSNTFRVYWHR
jgi:hypothetical protein